jgi:hypothetical protein
MAKSKINKWGVRVYKSKKRKQEPVMVFHKGTMEEFIDEYGNTKVYITLPWWETLQIL